MEFRKRIAICMFLLVTAALVLAVVAVKYGHHGSANHGAISAEMVAVYAGTSAAVVSSRKKRANCSSRKDAVQ